MTGKREQNRELQRQRILEAAQFLFATRGLEDVTMADVAALAEVARATVFNHFGSKHALVEAITENVFAYYLGMLGKALDAAETPVPTLVRALFDQMGVGIELYRQFYRGVFREIAKLQFGLDEGGAAQRAREESIERVKELLERGQKRGELSAAHRATDLAWGFDSLVNGTIRHWLYDDASQPLRESMQRAAEIFLGPVAPDAPAPDWNALPSLAPEGFSFEDTQPGVAAPAPTATEGSS